jgi:rhomboid protease GluP
MKFEELRRSEYAHDKGKLLRIFLLSCAFVAGAIWLSFHPPAGTDLRLIIVLMLITMALFGYVALSVSRKLLSKRPGMVVSTAGLRLWDFPGQIVPWSAIRSFDRIQSKYVDSIVLQLDPLFARTLIKRGRFFGSRSKINVVLSNLNGHPAQIYYEFSELASAAREAEAQAPQEGGSEVLEPVLHDARYPVFTYVLIAILVAVYACELAFGVDEPQDGAPSVRTLYILGGTFRQSIIGDGEWWRLFTAPFLHGNILHLVFNCIALWFAGRLFERLIGWRWFAAIFFVSALGGSVASVWINPPGIVGVGASGGIIGLFAAVIVGSVRFRSSQIAYALQAGAIRILIPSLLPLFGAAKGGDTIDYAAHLGGAATGAVLTLLLLRLWPRKRPTPRFAAAAIGFSALFVIVTLVSLLPIIYTRQFIVDNPMINYFAGNYQQAATGFAGRAVEDPTTAPYFNLWRYLAQKRGNDTKANDDLAVAARQMDQGAWPYPVYSLFLGELRPVEVMAKAADNNQRCEAAFYNGEWYLMSGDTTEARQLFQTALSSCPTTYLEYDGAKGELNRLDAH